MEDRSFFIIKPDSLIHKHEIIYLIYSQISITALYNVKLTKRMLLDLYPEADQLEMYIREKEYNLINKESTDVVIGIVDGRNAIKKLIRIAGEKINPAECSPETIRYKFGKHAPVEFNNLLIYLNSIHRPKNRNELMDGLRFIYINF